MSKDSCVSCGLPDVVGITPWGTSLRPDVGTEFWHSGKSVTRHGPEPQTSRIRHKSHTVLDLSISCCDPVRSGNGPDLHPKLGGRVTCTYVFVCIHVCTCVHTRTCLTRCSRVPVCVRVSTCVYVCPCVRFVICTCTHVRTRVYPCLCVCVYVYTSVRVRSYVHVFPCVSVGVYTCARVCVGVCLSGSSPRAGLLGPFPGQL